MQKDFCNSIGHHRTHALQQNLFNHLVGGGRVAQRNGEGERLRSLRVRFETRRGPLGVLWDGQKARRMGATAPPMEAKTAHHPLGQGFRNGL